MNRHTVALSLAALCCGAALAMAGDVEDAIAAAGAKVGLSGEQAGRLCDEMQNAYTRAVLDADKRHPLERSQGLKKGDTFALREVTPLCPSPNPHDALRALTEIRQIAAGSSFAVVGVRSTRTERWYSVRIVTGDRRGEVGWINAVALMGQYDKSEFNRRLKAQEKIKEDLQARYVEPIAKRDGLTPDQAGDLCLKVEMLRMGLTPKP